MKADKQNIFFIIMDFLCVSTKSSFICINMCIEIYSKKRVKSIRIQLVFCYSYLFFQLQNTVIYASMIEMCI